MATNIAGIVIVIKAFLPTGKTLDEQFAALSIVKDAHAEGDYSKLLAAASIDEVKTEQKVRRMEDTPSVPSGSGPADGLAEPSSNNSGPQNEAEPEPAAEVEQDNEGGDESEFTGDPLDQPVAEEPEKRRRMAR